MTPAPKARNDQKKPGQDRVKVEIKGQTESPRNFSGDIHVQKTQMRQKNVKTRIC